MLRTQKPSDHYPDADEDDDDERHGSIELKDILKRKLPTPNTDDDSQHDDDDDDDDTTNTADDSAAAAAATDDNHIGRLTPQYRKTHRHRTAIPRKTAALAVFLTLVGLGFTCLGLSFWFSTGGSLGESVPFFVLGGLSFIPGSFHVVILYLAYTGQYGWTYDHIPTYERQ